MLVRLGRVLLLAAFLLAQQSALAHQIWHLAGGAAQSAALGDLPKTNPLCEQHDALGTVLGGLSSSLALAALEELRPVHFPAANLPAASTPSLSPVSRGPPALL